MQRDLAFAIDIPAGYRMLAENVEVIGVHFFLEDAKRFAAGKNQALMLEQDRKNPKNRNAIKVIGICRGWFANKKYLIGHVPMELADTIAKRRIFDTLKPILASIWWSGESNEFINVRFHIIEPTLGNWGKSFD